MTSVLVRAKVEDYGRWRAVYDEMESKRASSGMEEVQVFHDSDDMNSITILFKITDAEKAQAYVDSDELKEAQQRGGVIPPPTVIWLTEA